LYIYILQEGTHSRQLLVSWSVSLELGAEQNPSISRLWEGVSHGRLKNESGARDDYSSASSLGRYTEVL